MIVKYKDLIKGFDRRHKVWGKILKRVDMSKKNGYAFEGQFLRETDELNEPCWLLLYNEQGSAKYHYPYVFLYRFDGKEIALKKEWEAIKGGSWALQIRDEVAELIKPNEEPWRDYNQPPQEINNCIPVVMDEAESIKYYLVERVSWGWKVFQMVVYDERFRYINCANRHKTEIYINSNLCEWDEVLSIVNRAQVALDNIKADG